jgi:histidinol-phosphate aminotransferase
MAAAIEDDTAVVFVANPNNPTGTVVGEAELIAFLDKVPAEVMVVLDEAYVEYSSGPDAVDGVSLLSRYPNLIVTRTFSKAWGLAALRVGYAVAAEAITDLLNRVRAPFNVNSLGLAAAVAVLDDDEYLRAGCEVNAAGMAQLQAGFDQLGLSYIPSVGNFIAFELPTDPMAVYRQLLNEGVIVRPVAGYDMPKHLRVSIGLERENATFLAALNKVLAP